MATFQQAAIYHVSHVDSTSRQRSTISVYDLDRNLIPTSPPNLPVPNQETETRNSLQEHNHGIDWDFLKSLPGVGNGLDEAQVEKAAEDLKSFLEPPHKPILGKSQIVASPCDNPSIDSRCTIKSKNNNGKHKQEGREGTSKDETTLANEGTKIEFRGGI
ncbi:OLC1v1005785C1 [Oldenlandia corymbosa var. corymbosa]|uniref:OLC1v1005785C1 n=1 Tax=Oldenlandia corymbosa var. corymbosa TaxID=529605 RepID=A0AAV1DG29_OLDCO|nr:OLC1v1005785C1 [Oldenlandia corymbosa var. corymbosa]